MQDIPLQVQIRAVQRELAYRKRVYPARVRQSSIKADQARYQIEVFEAIALTL